MLAVRGRVLALTFSSSMSGGVSESGFSGWADARHQRKIASIISDIYSFEATSVDSYRGYLAFFCFVFLNFVCLIHKNKSRGFEELKRAL